MTEARSGEVAVVLAVDIGTTSVKAACYAEDGAPIGSTANVRHRGARSDGMIDPSAVLRSTLDALALLDLGGVQCVAISTMWQSLVRVSPFQKAPPTAVTWETAHPDDRIAAAAIAIEGVWDACDSGAKIHPSYPLLMAAAEGGGRDRLVDIGGWVVEQLTGSRAGWSEAIAAGSGMWSAEGRAWSSAVDAGDLRTGLLAGGMFTSALIASDLHPEVSSDLREASWLPTLPDGLCHNLGVGAVDSTIAITVGTSGSVRAVSDCRGRAWPSGFWRARCSRSVCASGGAISSAGNTLEWAEQFSGEAIDWTSFDSAAPILPGPVAVPDVFGRRGPDYPWHATGTISGLGPMHTAADVAAAFGLDVWAPFAESFDALRSVMDPSTVHVGGGLIERYPIAAQLLCDAIDWPIEVSSVPNPSLRGAAIYGLEFLASDRRSASLDRVVTCLRRGEFAPRGSGALVEPRSAWTRALRRRWGFENLSVRC